MYKSARKEAIENCQAQPNDLMGMILRASQFDHDVNMEDLVDEFLTFFIAGKCSVYCQASVHYISEQS